jgi:tetratricopeptide (TPR) repeat protein
MNMNEAARQVSLWLGESGCAFFVGAGISIAAPTCLPSAATLKSQIFETLAFRDFSRQMLHSLDAATQNRLKALPLELVLQVVEEWMDALAYAPLNAMSLAVPNSNHRILARAVTDDHAAIITTNFDTCIEQSLPGMAYTAASAPDYRHLDIRLRSGLGGQGVVVKLHGTAGDEASLSATIRRIGLGLGRDKSAVLRWYLSRWPACFLGYSGSDLDIMPSLRRLILPDSIWVIRSRRVDESRADYERAHSTIRQLMAERHGHVIVADIQRFLGTVAELRGIDVKPVVGHDISREVLQLTAGWLDREPSAWKQYAVLGKWLEYAHALIPSAKCYQRVVSTVGGHNRRVAARVYADLGSVYRRANRYGIAERAFARCLEKSAPFAPSIEHVRGLIGMARVLNSFGRAEEAERGYAAAVDEATAIGHTRELGMAYIGLGVSLKNRGDVAGAERFYREAMDVYTRLGDLFGKAQSLTNLGNIQRGRGRLQQAATSLRRAHELWNALGYRYAEGAALYNLGQVYLLGGELRRAEDCFGAAEPLLRLLGTAQDVAKVERALAGDPEESTS